MATAPPTDLETTDVAGSYRVDHVDLRSFDVVAQELLDVAQRGRRLELGYTMYSFEPEDWVCEGHPDLERQLSLARASSRTTVRREQLHGEIAAVDSEQSVVEVRLTGGDEGRRYLHLESRRFTSRA